MVTNISGPTSHVFLGRGRYSEGCTQRKEQSDYVWEIQAQGRNHQGASVCTAVTDRLTNIAKGITAFTESWGFPQKVRAGLGGGGPGLCYLSRGVRGGDEAGGEGVCRRLKTLLLQSRARQDVELP